MAYTIMINEDQRIDLLEMIKKNGETEALEYWEGMLSDLPKEEAESPGILHGFCL